MGSKPSTPHGNTSVLLFGLLEFCQNIKTAEGAAWQERIESTAALILHKEWRGKKELSQTTQFSCICQSESQSRPLKLQKEWRDKKELSQPPSFLS